MQAYGNFLERNGRAAEAQKIYRAYLETDENPLVLAALESSLKNVKPQPSSWCRARGGRGAVLSRHLDDG